MPTATGRETADEKRERQHREKWAAIRKIAAEITDPAQVAADAAAYLASTDAHGQRKHEYPAGQEYKVGRVKVDEGEARTLALRDAVDAIEPATRYRGQYMSFGLFAGRSTMFYGLREYVR